jgi:hypothetical protein
MANNTGARRIAPVKVGDKVTLTDQYGQSYPAIVDLVTVTGAIILKLGSK